jgi:ligand-binding SRPBCC domain-containing protein
VGDLRIHTLQREQWVDRPLEKVFPFFERPENLALITPPSLGFRLLTPSPVAMEQGRIIDYTIRVLGVRVRWRSLISTYEPPFRFVDEQLMGPYSFWHHTHRFAAEGSGTRLLDEVRYALPAYLPQPLATLLHRLQVEPTLKHIFDYRQHQFRRLFGGQPTPGDAAAANLATEY